MKPPPRFWESWEPPRYFRWRWWSSLADISITLGAYHPAPRRCARNSPCASRLHRHHFNSSPGRQQAVCGATSHGSRRTPPTSASSEPARGESPHQDGLVRAKKVSRYSPPGGAAGGGGGGGRREGERGAREEGSRCHVLRNVGDSGQLSQAQLCVKVTRMWIHVRKCEELWADSDSWTPLNNPAAGNTADIQGRRGDLHY